MNRHDWRSILNRYPTDCRPIGPVETLGNAGGFSGSQFWRFDAARGRLVLRMWPIEGSWDASERTQGWLKAAGMLPGCSGIEQVHGWLRIAGTLPYVPLPIRASDGRPLLEGMGTTWELCPWMPGVADLDRPPAEGHVRAAFTGLANFHRQFTPARMAPSPGIAARQADLERWIGGEFVKVRERLPPVGADPRSDLARVWIDRASRKVQPLRGLLGSVKDLRVPIQPCLRDARPDHFLFEGDRLTGLVDFGAMGMDAVSGDLARLLGEWLGSDRSAREVALDAYRSVRPIVEEEARLIPVFEAANAVLGAGRWVRWHFLQNRRFDDRNAVLDGLRRGLERMDEAEQGPGPGPITS